MPCSRRIRLRIRGVEEITEPFEKVLDVCGMLRVDGQLKQPTLSCLHHLLVETIKHGTRPSPISFRQEGNHKGAAFKDRNVARSEHLQRMVGGGPRSLQPGRMFVRKWWLDQYSRKDSVLAFVSLNLDTKAVQKRLRTAELPMLLLLFVFRLGHRPNDQLYARRYASRPIPSLKFRLVSQLT